MACASTLVPQLRKVRLLFAVNRECFLPRTVPGRPAAPTDTYQANGLWNRDTVTVFPSLRLVVAVRVAHARVFPGKEWAVATPESQGLDGAKLDEAVALLARTIDSLVL